MNPYILALTSNGYILRVVLWKKRLFYVCSRMKCQTMRGRHVRLQVLPFSKSFLYVTSSHTVSACREELEGR